MPFIFKFKFSFSQLVQITNCIYFIKCGSYQNHPRVKAVESRTYYAYENFWFLRTVPVSFLKRELSTYVAC